jgi:hypothetical protein
MVGVAGVDSNVDSVGTGLAIVIFPIAGGILAIAIVTFAREIVVAATSRPISWGEIGAVRIAIEDFAPASPALDRAMPKVGRAILGTAMSSLELSVRALNSSSEGGESSEARRAGVETRLSLRTASRAGHESRRDPSRVYQRAAVVRGRALSHP